VNWKVRRTARRQDQLLDEVDALDESERRKANEPSKVLQFVEAGIDGRQSYYSGAMKW